MRNLCRRAMAVAVVALLMVSLLVTITGCGGAATLTIKYTLPTQLNGGSCAAPILSLSPMDWTMTGYVFVTGPATWSDSISAAPGQPLTFTRSGLPAGLYTIRAFARNAYGWLCDTTTTRLAGDPPTKIAFQ